MAATKVVKVFYLENTWCNHGLLPIKTVSLPCFFMSYFSFFLVVIELLFSLSDAFEESFGFRSLSRTSMLYTCRSSGESWALTSDGRVRKSSFSLSSLVKVRLKDRRSKVSYASFSWSEREFYKLVEKEKLLTMSRSLSVGSCWI